MLTVLATLLVVPASVLTLSFTIEVAAGLAKTVSPPAASLRRPTAVIIMPAHDEAAIIGHSLASLASELAPDMRLLVVADNCEDDTVLIARGAGVEVIERSDPSRRGKGFALAFARDHLHLAPPDAIVVIDADCSTDRASLTSLVSFAVTNGRPVQAVNLLKPDLNAEPMVQVSNFAFLIKNLVRQAGLARLSGHVHLTGTGMAFPWALFAAAPLATADVVEDLGLGLDFSASGTPPLFARNASVWSGASSSEGTLKQRTRWEGGFISTSLRRGPKMVLRAIRDFDIRLLWAALSLMIPPLALLTAFNVITIIVSLPLVALGASAIPATVQILIGAAAAATILTVWRKFGKPFLSHKAAAQLPLYVLWKVPLYFRLLKRPNVSWLRTGR